MEKTSHEQIYRLRTNDHDLGLDLESLAQVVATGDEHEVAAELARRFGLHTLAKNMRGELITA
jgi:hypothetical protein